MMDSYSYVVRKPCGCIIGAITDDAPDVAEQVAEWLKEGRAVDRVTNAEVCERFHFGKCPHEQQQLEMFKS